MDPQKPGNSPGSGPEVVERQKITKERAFSIREVKRTAAKERKRDEYSSAEGQ